MKKKFVYLATVALIAGGTVLAQNSIPQDAIDSFTAGLLECQCASEHHDADGTLGVVKEYERVRAWRPENTIPEMARTVPEKTQPGAMGSNEGRSRKDTGSDPSDGRAEQENPDATK